MILKCKVLYYKLLSRKFHDKIFMIIVKFMKIMKIFDHENLELYGSLYTSVLIKSGYAMQVAKDYWLIVLQ